LSERDVERTIRKQAILDRDWAFSKRNDVVTVKNNSLEFRDAAVLKRDQVIAEIDEALVKKREALESRDLAVS